jgi:hypothetical protein
LFVPVLVSSQSNEQNGGESYAFELSGESLYPCGLMLSIYKDDARNITMEKMEVTVKDEKSAQVVVNKSMFVDYGIYYGYLVFGPDWKYETDPVVLLKNTNSSSGKEINIGLMILGIIGSFIFIITVITMVGFFIWCKRFRRKKELKEETVIKFVFY